jgi:uncharacterized protein (DUF58 family)
MNDSKSEKMPDRSQRDGEQESPAARNITPERILQRLDWQVIRRLDGLLQGDYRSLFYGYGVDFADLREYQPEDDVRYIDWNVTARMDTPYVRQYVEDREINAWFLIDLSPSMDFGTTQSEKRTVLIDLVATMARLLTRHGNRVGAVLYSGQVARSGAGQIAHRVERVIPAKGGRNHVLRLINDLLKQPRLPKAAFTDLNAMLEGGLVTIKRRSLIFILSDFISASGWERPLRLLTQRHEVLAIRFFDPLEMELPDAGPIWMEDSETGEQLYVDTHDPKFRSQYAEAIQRRDADLTATFRRAGVELWSLSTGEDLVRAILRHAMVRKQIHRIQGKAISEPLPAGTGSWR